MRQHLGRDELESLREVTRGLMQRTIPDEHEERLASLGLIERVLGGVKITAAGQVELRRRRPIGF